jgi:hypothetical protein
MLAEVQADHGCWGLQAVLLLIRGSENTEALICRMTESHRKLTHAELLVWHPMGVRSIAARGQPPELQRRTQQPRYA